MRIIAALALAIIVVGASRLSAQEFSTLEKGTRLRITHGGKTEEAILHRIASDTLWFHGENDPVPRMLPLSAVRNLEYEVRRAPLGAALHNARVGFVYGLAAGLVVAVAADAIDNGMRASDFNGTLALEYLAFAIGTASNVVVACMIYGAVFPGKEWIEADLPRGHGSLMGGDRQLRIAFSVPLRLPGGRR